MKSEIDFNPSFVLHYFLEIYIFCSPSSTKFPADRFNFDFFFSVNKMFHLEQSSFFSRTLKFSEISFSNGKSAIEKLKKKRISNFLFYFIRQHAWFNKWCCENCFTNRDTLYSAVE